MLNILLLSGVAIACIAVGACIVVVGVAVLLSLLLGKKKFIEVTPNADELIQVVDVTEKDTSYGAKTQVIAPSTHTVLIYQNGKKRNVLSGDSCLLYENPIKGGKQVRIKIIYVSKTAKLTIPWGTRLQNRISYLEPKLGRPVSVGAFGVMDVRIGNPETFYERFYLTCTKENLQDELRTQTVDRVMRLISRALTDIKPNFYEFSNGGDGVKNSIQNVVNERLSEEFREEFGFELTKFIVENINVSKEDEEAISASWGKDSAHKQEMDDIARKKERVYAESDLHNAELDTAIESAPKEDILANRERDRLRDDVEYARKLQQEDEDRALLREEKKHQWDMESKELDSQDRRVESYYGAVKEVGWEGSPQKEPSKKEDAKGAGRFCSVCGSSYEPNAQFCPNCGAVIPHKDVQKICPNCNASVQWGTKFCPKCGNKIEYTKE